MRIIPAVETVEGSQKSEILPGFSYDRRAPALAPQPSLPFRASSERLRRDRPLDSQYSVKMIDLMLKEFG